MSAPVTTTMDALLHRYDALLLDAYGVLVHGEGAVPGAGDLIGHLNAAGYPYLVVTNDASRQPETAARRYQHLGLEIPAKRVLTSGSLLVPYFRENGLTGKRCAVLGPPDSCTYVETAGGRLVSPDTAFDVLVVADDAGLEPFLDTLNATLTSLLTRLDAGEPVALVLPNPDLLFPRGAGAVGITSGAIAALFEAVLAERYPQREDLRFQRLGKPNTPIFAEAVRRLDTDNVVMIGDQLATDIRGANQAGLDSALFMGGLSGPGVSLDGPRPTYRLDSLGLQGKH